MATSRTASRTTSRSNSGSTSRAATAARTEILTQLKEDHKRVKKAYRDFQKLDVVEDPQSCQALVMQVLNELTVHATLEEELLYPAARSAMSDESLVDEAEVEHESVRVLIEQLRGMGPDDEKYAARFTVLCEYVMHHVKEEETEMFPQLESSRLDWESIAKGMTLRRGELSPADEAHAETDAATESAAINGAEADKPARGASSRTKGGGAGSRRN